MLVGDPNAKCLIFSSYTSYLDILQRHLAAAGHACARIDGSQTVKKREEAIDLFHHPDVSVMLMVSCRKAQLLHGACTLCCGHVL